MRTKHLFNLIHIRNKGDVGTVKNIIKPSSYFLTRGCNDQTRKHDKHKT